MNKLEKLQTLFIFLAVIIGLLLGHIPLIALALVVGPLIELPLLIV